MIGYTLTYDAPRSAQPHITFRAGRKVVTIANGETLHTSGTAEDFARLPSGVKAEPTAKPKPGNKESPGAETTPETTRTEKAEE